MKLRSFGLVASLVLMAFLCLSSSKAEAILASVKTLGMAGAGVAYPQDAEAAAYNPAGMADVGDRLDVGVEWARVRRQADVHGNLAPIPGVNGSFNASRTRDFYNVDFGINKQLPWYESPLGWYSASVGFVVYNRDFIKTTYTRPFVILGTSNLGLEYIQEVFAPTFAVKICERHNFGISADYHVQRLMVNGIQNFDNFLFTVAPGFATNRGYSYANGWGFTLGYRGQICDWLSVGLVYQPRTRMGRFHKYKGFDAQHGRLDVPRKIAAGVAIRVLPCATVAFDYENLQWTRIRELHNPLAANLFLDRLGTENGSGFGYPDQNIYRLGVDYDVMDCLTLRAGFQHSSTVTRDSQTAINLLLVNTVKNFITVGTTWRINCCSELSAFYAHGFNHKVRGRNSIPLLFGAGEVDLSGDDNVLGVSWGWNY